jgi:hypothetical protein
MPSKFQVNRIASARFAFRWADGMRICDRRGIQRISNLRMPPGALADRWICCNALKLHHFQAGGIFRLQSPQVLARKADVECSVTTRQRCDLTRPNAVLSPWRRGRRPLRPDKHPCRQGTLLDLAASICPMDSVGTLRGRLTKIARLNTA